MTVLKLEGLLPKDQFESLPLTSRKWSKNIKNLHNTDAKRYYYSVTKNAILSQIFQLRGRFYLPWSDFGIIR